MTFFKYLTPISYWLLIIMWSAILAFYLHRMRMANIGKTGQFFKTLLLILAIDAFRTLVESLYFGTWYTSLIGLFPYDVHELLMQPQYVFIPKAINFAAAAIIIAILLLRWLPQEQEAQFHRYHHVESMQKEISEHKHMETALRESEKRYRELYETSLVPLFRTSIEDGTILHANHATARLFGYPDAATLIRKQMKTIDLYAVEKRAEVIALLKKDGEINDFEIHVVFSDGREADLSVTAKLFKEKGYIEGAALDISDRKRAEAEIRVREKLQGVLEMAGAISHEINQPLQSIMGYSELALMELTSEHPLVEDLNAIKKQAERLGFITRKLSLITRYETKEYIKSTIIDIDKASLTKEKP